MAPQDYDIFGAPKRESSNSFASGSNQNVGNHVTNTPTTRVSKPPGGTSSICLGSSEGGGEPFRFGKARVPPPQSYETSRISLAWDHGSSTSAHRPQSGGKMMASKSQSDDVPVAGVRANRLQEAVETTDRLGKMRQKQDPDRCSTVSDRLTGEAVRFHKDTAEQRVGRQQKPSALRPEANKSACESHRFYLAADGQADRVPGKERLATSSDAGGSFAQRPQSRTSLSGAEPPSKPRWNSSSSKSGYPAQRGDADAYSQSRQSKSSRPTKAYGSATSLSTATSARYSKSGYSGCQSECDSLPLGADWSNF